MPDDIVVEIPNMTERIGRARGELGPDAYALIAGYPASCFARITETGWDFPPGFQHLSPGGFELPWTLFHDLRVFSSKGELHAWREGTVWRARHRLADAIDEHPKMTRFYPILGRRRQLVEDGWVLRTEERGPRVWIPAEVDMGPDHRPALRIDQLIEQDHTGLFGVVDAVIRGFASSGDNDHE